MQVDTIIRGGSVVDGSGSPRIQADVAIDAGRIAAVGDLAGFTPRKVLDAEGCVVTPGFINVLSHAYYTLQQDPRGLSDLYQGVTTEVFGEGVSLGPVQGKMTEVMVWLGDSGAGVRHGWPTLWEFLSDLEAQGIGQNVASFVGAANLRMCVVGLEDRALTPDELRRAAEILDREMNEGALGVGSALIYPPGSYATTDELIAFCHVVARHDGLYISHVRNEGDRLFEAVDELIDIAKSSSARAEIYHLKTAGQDNWSKMTRVIERIESARVAGIDVTADIYPYAAGSTALSASIPPQFHLGGIDQMRRHLRSAEGRAAIADAIDQGGDWESLWRMSGGAAGVVILSSHPDLGIEPGASLKTIAERRGDMDPVMTMLDIVDAAPTADAAYFIGSEESIKAAFAKPWVSVCSDSDAPAAEEAFEDHPVHPRAYGAFARVLGRYARDESIVTLEEAVHRMTGHAAKTLRLVDRGILRVGAYADIAVLDPETVTDLATYDEPAQYARGMRHVLVNGAVAFKDGQPTGVLAGQALRRKGSRDR